MHNPAAYWRTTSQWQSWLGKKGKVLATTMVHVAPPELKAFAPYSYAVVEVEGQRVEFLGADHQVLEVGDEVVCVLRRLSVPTAEQLIPYGIKVAKLPR